MRIINQRDLPAGVYASDDGVIALTTDGTETTITLDLQLAQTAPAPPPPSSAPPPATTHVVAASYVSTKGVVWAASTTVGEDAGAPAKIVRFTDPDGNVSPGMELRAYADGCYVCCTRCDNPYSYLDNHLTVKYDGAVVLDVEHANFWRGRFGTAIRYGKPLAWDAAKIDRTLLPNYAPGQQAPFDDSDKDYGFDKLGIEPVAGMSTTGDRYSIGYLPIWVTAFLTNPAQATFDVMLRADDSESVFPYAWTDPETGGVIDITKYPNATLLPASHGTFAGNPIVPGQGAFDGNAGTGCPYAWEEAHHTGAHFVTAMVTGSARHRDLAALLANNALIALNPTYRQQHGVFNGYQTRGTAWALRSIFLAAYTSSEQDYFKARLSEQLAFANAHPKAPGGWMGTYIATENGDRDESDWMETYARIVVDVIARKIPDWDDYANYLAGNTTFLLLDDAGNPRPTYPFATLYRWVVVDANWHWLPDYPSQLTASMRHAGFSQANIDAVLAPDATAETAYHVILAHDPQWAGKLVNGVSDLMQYVSNSGAYPALMRAAAAIAAERVPKGAAAWKLVTSLPTQPNFSHDYRFNIVPAA